MELGGCADVEALDAAACEVSGCLGREGVMIDEGLGIDVVGVLVYIFSPG